MVSTSETGLVVLTVAYHSNKALRSLAKDLSDQSYQPGHWLIVNNSPNSGGSITLDAHCRISIINGHEGDGFGQGCNRGLDELHRQGWVGWIWLLNPDTTFLNDETLQQIHGCLGDFPQQALVGTALIDAQGCLEESAGWIDPGLRFRSRKVKESMSSNMPLNVDWLSGCSLLIRPSAHSIAPRFDEAFPLYYEDVDLCLRLTQKGIPIIWLSSVKVIHKCGEGSNTPSARRIRLSACSYIRFLQRHRSKWVLLLRSFRLFFKAVFGLAITPIKSSALLRGWFEACRRPLK